jgi:hypothetical protein
LCELIIARYWHITAISITQTEGKYATGVGKQKDEKLNIQIIK